jgi:hypothetical protein
MAAQSGTSTITFLVEWFNSSGALLSGSANSSITPNTNWQQIPINLTAPANVYNVRFTVTLNNANNGTRFYYDDFSLSTNVPDVITPLPPSPPFDDCQRQAWLDLGNNQWIKLEDKSAGYFCTQLDLGYPAVREVMDNRADANGAIDRTKYVGPRTVSANITALTGAGAQIDQVASMFAPFMVPSARPVLHYALDRPGTPERILTLRASGYSWPIVGPYQRDIQLQWVAADPIARDVTVNTATAWSGSSTTPGRTYPLTFDRVYPSGGGSAEYGQLYIAGDVPIRPKIRIYGPITQPSVGFSGTTSGGFVIFLYSYTIPAGAWVDIDCELKTAYLNSGGVVSSAANGIDWARITQWPYLSPNTSYTMMLTGGTTSNVTQAVATWQNGYID